MASLHGYEITAELPLEPACAAPGRRGAVRLDSVDGETLLGPPADLTALRLDDRGAPAFAIARRAGVAVVWDRGRGAYAAEPGAGRIAAAPRGHAAAWGHLVATVVLPLLLVERGDLALHASAVLGPRGAVLFCGPSGRGKSSAAFLAARGLGRAVLADDAVMVTPHAGEPVAWPGGAQLWVNEHALAAAGASHDDPLAASRAARRPLPTGGSRPGPFPIQSIVVLDERGREGLARPLEPVAAVAELVPCLVHAGDPESLRASFARLAAALERIPAWSVSLPDDPWAGGEAIAAVLDL